MKYAVLESGGKQYIAREGETIDVDRLPLEVGKSVSFNSVLLVVDEAKVQVGKPEVKGAKVKGKVVAQVKGPKVVVFKYKPKQRYRRKQGHRQRYTRVSISKIDLPSTAKKKASAGSEKPSSSKKSPAAAKSTSAGKKTDKK